MGLDARVRYTKAVIQESLIALLREKPLNKITVKELCQRAEINRATFYKYYADIFDLLEKLEEGFLTELRNVVNASGGQNVTQTLTAILRELQMNWEIYQVLFSENGDRTFSNRVFRVCWVEYAAFRPCSDLPEPQRSWLYCFAAQGSSGVLNCWVRGGMREPPEEAAAFIETLITNAREAVGIRR